MDELEKMTKLNKAKSKQITQLEKEIDELNSEVKQLEQNNIKLTDEIDLLKKKQFYCNGQIDALLTIYRIQNEKPITNSALATALEGLNDIQS